MSKPVILKNCIIASYDVFINNGEILIESGKIKKLDKSGNISKKYTDNATIYDLKGRLVLPGFVNAHSHLYSSLSKGLSPVGPNNTFHNVLSNFWWPLDAALDEESVYYSAMSGLLDAVKHGVTCVFDHHASMNYVDNSLETIEHTFNEIGIKGVLCFETSNRKSNTNFEKHIEENITFAENHINNEQIKGMFGLHANLTLSDKELSQISDTISNFSEPIPIHIHCGEAEDDLKYCKESGYEGPVDRLNKFNLLTSKSLLAHCVHISKTDKDIINNIQPWIVLNSESNANNRVGKVNRESFDKYLLGTDGMSFDMISSFRSHYLLGKGLSEDFTELYNLLFNWQNQFANLFFNSIGHFKEGFDADIAVLDYIPETEINADNLIGHLIFGAKGGNVFMTISNGKILYHNGNFTFLSEETIKNEIREAATRLHRRYYG
ncbi:MAG: amidohydrolase family protein [Spirochaetales bacterium]|nr:amidohydrolase family protein [Spirochaetales bacterium]